MPKLSRGLVNDRFVAWILNGFNGSGGFCPRGPGEVHWRLYPMSSDRTEYFGVAVRIGLEQTCTEDRFCTRFL